MRLHSWRTKFRLCAALMLVAPCLTGCWDRLEMEQRAAVLGIAIDTVDDSSKQETSGGGDASSESSTRTETSDTSGARPGTSDVLDDPSMDVTGSTEVPLPAHSAMRLTAQIAVPGRIPLGPGEGGGGSGASSQNAVWVLHTYGKTLNDAIQRLQQQVADRLFFGHLRVIVVSDKFARQPGLEGVSDALRRNPEIRRTAWLIVAKDDAAAIMMTAPPLERVPTLYLMATMEHATQLGKLPDEPLGSFASHSIMKGREATLPYVDVAQKQNIIVKGLAFFRGYRMVDSTKRPFDVATCMELNGQRTGGYSILVSVPGESGSESESEAVMWQAYRRKKRIKVDIQHGVPHFTVNIHIDGSIVGKSGERINVNDPRVVHKIDQEIRRRLLENIDTLVKQTQSQHTDVFGLGEILRARKAGYWDRFIRTKQKWEEVYSTITVTPHVSIRTHRIGMKGI